MRTIPLSRGLFAIVDDEDFDRVSQFKWSATSNGKYGPYAVRCLPNKTFLYLHRFVLDAAPNQEVDHKNGLTLDCRRTNLRFATRRQQMCNTTRKPTRSPYKGVWPSKSLRNPWCAMIGGSPRTYLGVFPTAETAARAYDDAARKMYGEFANLNFPIADA